jgi:hypothetical protein
MNNLRKPTPAQSADSSQKTDSSVMELRRAKLGTLRQQGTNPFANNVMAERSWLGIAQVRRG